MPSIIRVIDSHTELADLTNGDGHPQYVLLAGRAGGQTLYGGTAANDDISISGTSHATKTTSYVLLQPTGGNVGIGTTTPDAPLTLDNLDNTFVWKIKHNGTLVSDFVYETAGTKGLGFFNGIYLALENTDTVQDPQVRFYNRPDLSPTRAIITAQSIANAAYEHDLYLISTGDTYLQTTNANDIKLQPAGKVVASAQVELSKSLADAASNSIGGIYSISTFSNTVSSGNNYFGNALYLQTPSTAFNYGVGQVSYYEMQFNGKTGGSWGAQYGLFAKLKTMPTVSTGNLTSATAVNAMVDHNGTGTITGAYGLQSQVILRNGAGNITGAYGVSLIIKNESSGAGTILEGVGVLVNAPTATGAITTAKGVRIDNQGAATIANAYGLYIAAITGATTLNYAIYSAGGLSYHAGTMQFGNSIQVGGTAARGTTAGTNRIDIFDGTAPVGTLANGISIYSSGGECYIMDSAGNATLQSPHDPETGEWIFWSRNTVTGRTYRVDMERMVAAIEALTGQSFTTETFESQPN